MGVQWGAAAAPGAMVAMSDRRGKLRAWVYLRAPAAVWTESSKMGLSEAQVLAMSEERLKVIAVSIVFAAAMFSREKAFELAGELEDLGYTESDLAAAKSGVSRTVADIIGHRDQGEAAPGQASVPPAT